MSGELNLLLILCCALAAQAAGKIPPPSDLQISYLDFGKVNVSWTHSAHLSKTAAYAVRVNVPDMQDAPMEFTRDNFYIFDWLTLHRGVTAEVAIVEITEEPITFLTEWASEDLPPLPGDESTAPVDLTCDVHISVEEKLWLSCEWLAGENAPPDTQYYLYFRYTDVNMKCLNSETKPGGGRRIGCRTLFSNNLLKEDKFLIHINGSSQSRQIQAMERLFDLHEAEVIPPVQNLILNMTEDKLLNWMKPIRSFPDKCFSYQINIWSEDKNETFTVNDSQEFWSEDLKDESKGRHVRVRAVGKAPCWQMYKYSSWTEVKYLEGKNDNMLWTILSVCLSVACLAFFLLCIRFWRRLFPQIPKPKDDLKDAFKFAQHQALMRCNSWDVEEVISYIEVVGYPDMQCRLSIDYVHVTD